MTIVNMEQGNIVISLWLTPMLHITECLDFEVEVVGRYRASFRGSFPSHRSMRVLSKIGYDTTKTRYLLVAFNKIYRTWHPIYSIEHCSGTC